MSTPSVRILVHQNFAGELAKELTVPHTVKTFKGETDAEMAQLLSATDVLVSGAYKAAWKDPKNCAVRLIHSTGAGTDGIDFTALPAGSTVCNVYGHERGVTEQAFMMMLALNKGLFALDSALRKGNWTPQRPYLPELRQRNLLILGAGHIGEELARWGKFLDMNVTVLTRTPSPERDKKFGAKVGRLADVGTHLQTADFVVVAIPAATGTIDFIGEKELNQMKPSAFIINVGRAPVINEAALYQALQTRRIAGAGLDVWYQYPAPGQNRQPSQLPFHELDNVIMTPHKPTAETMAYRWKEIADNIKRFVQDEPLRCVVSRA